MKTMIRIKDVHFKSAGPREAKNGLLGWVRCLLNDSIILDGLALRRTLDGRLVLSFPARRDMAGNLHHHLKPKDDATRIEIEQQVFQALGIKEGVA